jgi:type I restriction enzyme M protein
MVDASKGFTKDGPKNRLRSQDIHKIVDVFTKTTDVERYSRMVPVAEIAEPRNDYNLNIPRYIDSSEPEDLQDLHAHMHGGIPDRDVDALSPYWDAFPSLRAQLFKPRSPGYIDLTIDVGQVQETILGSAEFQKFAAEARDLCAEWFSVHRGLLSGIDANTKPNELIARISDDLLARFKPVALLDEYDIYEQLMTYWHDVMHDDVFLVMNEGWLGAAKPRKTIEDKDRKLSETPDLVVGSGRSAAKYKMDLIPPALIVSRYFADEQAKLDDLIAAADEDTRAVDEYVEEHAVENGLLADAMDDDKINRALASVQLRVAQGEGADPDEVPALRHLIGLYDAETAAKKALKEAEAARDIATFKKYGDLTESVAQTIVLDDKWHSAISRRINGEADSLTLALVARIQQLGERYDETVSALDASLHDLESKVAGHLAAMGIRP